MGYTQPVQIMGQLKNDEDDDDEQEGPYLLF